MNGPEVRGHTIADLVPSCGSLPLPVSVRLTWRPADPYAVELVFDTGRDDTAEVRWLVSRELLDEGLYHPAGWGDVWIGPHEDTALTVIELSSLDGVALFEFDTDDLSDFLLDTYDEVPPGAESLVIDLDAEIARLIGDPR